jgi:nicotinamidase/pyrazinamidase
MKALVIVDMQNDFMPGGALGVAGADRLIETINALIPSFPLVVASQDWHPSDHISFASNHKSAKPGDQVLVGAEMQVLWPDHCIQDTFGAELVKGLNQSQITAYFHKGTDQNIDSYSAFFDNARRKSTGLGEYLKERGVTDVYLVGVATDYCVLYSAFDAIDLGFQVHVIVDACRPINLDPKDEERALLSIAAKGGEIMRT